MGGVVGGKRVKWLKEWRWKRMKWIVKEWGVKEDRK